MLGPIQQRASPSYQTGRKADVSFRSIVYGPHACNPALVRCATLHVRS